MRIWITAFTVVIGLSGIGCPDSGIPSLDTLDLPGADMGLRDESPGKDQWEPDAGDVKSDTDEVVPDAGEVVADTAELLTDSGDVVADTDTADTDTVEVFSDSFEAMIDAGEVVTDAVEVETDVQAPECETVSDCNDMDPCTDNACIDHKCVFEPLPDCCLEDDECVDDDPCTTDWCEPMSGIMPGMCMHELDPACACDDENICTEDYMGPSGECHYTWIMGCCNTDDDCWGENICFPGKCILNWCVFEPVDCDDQDPCTIDSCIPFTGECVHSPVNCDDGNKCTEDVCDPKTGWCVFTPTDCDDGKPCTLDECDPATGKCLHSLDCDDGNECTYDFCDPALNFKCRHKTIDCDDDDDCTEDSCDPDTGCVYETVPDCCIPATVWSADFTGGQDHGFGFAPHDTPVRWQVSDVRSYSPGHALYFGNPGQENYEDPGAGAVFGTATSPPIAIPEAPASVLSFWTYVDVETIPQYDVFTVTIHAEDDDHVVWDKSLLSSDSFETWTEVIVNVTPFQGQSIAISFTFDSVDHLYNHFEGIHVDDVSIDSLCETLPWCQTDDECIDDNPCTKDLCTSNTCIHEIIPGCCQADSDCDDKYPCTIDTCQGNKCLHEEIPGCCVDTAECDDDNHCTKDECKDGECAYSQSGDTGCCESDSDCNDQDDCTNDGCIDYRCVFSPVPDCCTPQDVYFQNFPVNSPGGFTVVDDGSDVFWQVHNGRYFDEPFALYYGNPETGNYDNGGTTFGTATSQPFPVPPYGTPTLSFWLYLDVEMGPSYDSFRVHAQTGSSLYFMWTKDILTDPGVYKTWIPVDLDMSAFLGETVSVVFEFDSVDGNKNETEGVYLDTIRVDVSCP